MHSVLIIDNKEIKKSFIKIVINKGKNLEDLIDKYYS